jgi:hypothetical protein
MRELQNYEQNLVSGGEDDDEEIVVTAAPWTDEDEQEYLRDMGCTETVPTSNAYTFGGQWGPNGPVVVAQVQIPASTMTCPVGVLPRPKPATTPAPVLLPVDPYTGWSLNN